jgi:hypothetical protein
MQGVLLRGAKTLTKTLRLDSIKFVKCNEFIQAPQKSNEQDEAEKLPTERNLGGSSDARRASR